ncbi:hypothetical protein RHRU231_210050 [Rhodococcus ruber]|uniref:Transposase n=1 Tax=Rhodococcus ruber TaxID=1830 RepID=A0A098BEG5_9NOCA|nr:hypothetical protein RHRU231_210050 [Rhodococcus ruber]
MRTFFLGKVILMPNVYPAEVREKAVRLVLEHRGDYASEYEAIRTIAERMSLRFSQ